MGNISTNGTITANSFLGNATSATQLKNYYSSRPTSLNLTSTGSGGVISFKATSSVTDGSSEGYDGHVLHFYWDNESGWDAQVMIPNSISSTETRFAYRTQSGSQTWQAWKTVLDSSNYSSYALPLSGGTVTGNIAYKGSKATGTQIRFLDNTNDAYGNGIAVGYGGLTILGGGESALVLINNSGYTAGDEHTLIGADNAVHIYSNCQNGITSSYHWTFLGNGKLSCPGPIVYNSTTYGSSLPSSATTGQIYYKLT